MAATDKPTARKTRPAEKKKKAAGAAKPSAKPSAAAKAAPKRAGDAAVQPTTLDATYAALRAILAPYARSLRVGRDDATWLEVLTPEDRDGKPVWFGAVRLGKAYVSYYLMPLYVTPEIAKTISPALAKHRHGKSCFNFTRPDPALLAELATLTEAGLAAYRARGLA